MEHFDDSLLVDFLRRSYTAVDGLWFVKTEEEASRELAFRLDHAVWQVMPKIQARKAAELLGIERSGVDSLLRCQALKMTAEGYEFEIDPAEGKITLSVCPWYELLKKSGRTELAEPIFEKICSPELGAWCREFGDGIAHRIGSRICSGGSCCEIFFDEPAEPGW